MLTNILQGQTRKVVYAVYAFISLTVASIQVAYLSTGHQPMWVTIAVAVVLYVGTATGALAGGNITSVPSVAVPVTAAVTPPAIPTAVAQVSPAIPVAPLPVAVATALTGVPAGYVQTESGLVLQNPPTNA